MILGLRPRGIFIDTSAFFAISDSSDSNHDSAVATFATMNQILVPLVTSNFIRAETHALIVSRVGIDYGLRFLAALALSRTRLVRITDDDETQAISLVMRYRDKEFSLTDATSFVVMERLGLTDAFSFDSDFSQYGFRTLPDT